MDGSQTLLPAETRRRRFSAADVQAMLDAGVIKNGEKVELIGGELVEMSPQGPLHWDVTYAISRWFRKNLPDELSVASQGPLRLSEYHEPEPEFFVFRDGIGVNDVRGSDCVLVVEVAHSSLDLDLKVKALIYAEHGVREYWVVDVENRQTLVHQLRADATYGEPLAVPFDAPLSAPGGISLIVADLAPKS
ncbi:MAG TPA: Uma2 family endonuclease [Hyphomonadaceae bacterium]|nr:Uma2 family endonuclease [Hyphomonadaceae bacterium]